MSKTSGALRKDNIKNNAQAKKSAEYTAQDKMVLSYYQGAGYGLINNALRAGETSSATKLMDAAIAKNKLAQETVSYRGVTDIEKVLGMKITDPKKLIGKSIEEKSYMSVSSSKKVAQSFAEGGSGKSAVFKLKVPKGTHYADMDNATGIKAKEKEFLLKRG